ncbi:MAG: hypothetical protein ACK5Q5_18135 [Planctomycetaceae bacterium]
MSVLPTPFLVRFRAHVPRLDKLPRSGLKLLDLPVECRIPWPAELDGQTLPVDLRAAWNPRGIGFSLAVSGRTVPALSNPDSPSEPDAFELWIDTRDTQTVHRATRYCHHLCVLPTGGGDDGRDALTITTPVARAKDDAPLADSSDFLTNCRSNTAGYLLEVWIPASALQGFDPSSQSRLGFYCQLKDAEHGTLSYGAGNDFPAISDPSLWHTLELTDC